METEEGQDNMKQAIDLPEPTTACSSVSDPNSGSLDYLSASRLKTWQECRLKFYFRYVERIPADISPSLFIGRVIHRVLERWNLMRWRGEETSLDTLRPWFQLYWAEEQPQDGMTWNGKEPALQDKSWSMLAAYFQQTPIPSSEKPLGVEVSIECGLNQHGLPPLRGILDLVRAGGTIVDYKTTARAPNRAWAGHLHETQLSCYSLLYRQATETHEAGFELHFLTKGKQPDLVVISLAPLAAIQARRLITLMKSYVAGIEAEDFVPSPGIHCRWCDYFAECQAFNPNPKTTHQQSQQNERTIQR